MNTKDMKEWTYVIISIVALLLAVFLVLVVNDEIEERRRMELMYMAEHHCYVESYAGKDAIPVYRCDNGLKLGHDMWRDK